MAYAAYLASKEGFKVVWVRVHGGNTSAAKEGRGKEGTFAPMQNEEDLRGWKEELVN